MDINFHNKYRIGDSIRLGGSGLASDLRGEVCIVKAVAAGHVTYESNRRGWTFDNKIYDWHTVVCSACLDENCLTLRGEEAQ